MMDRRRRWVLFAVFIIGLVGSSTGVYAQAIPGFPPLEVKVAFPPTPLPAGGDIYLCYELHLTNYYPEPISVDRIEVFGGSDKGAPLVVYQGQELIDNVRRPGTDDDTNLTHPGPPTSASFLWRFCRLPCVR